MKNLFSKKYLFIFGICLICVIGLIYFNFFRKGPFERKVFLFEEETEDMIPGSLIFIGKKDLYIQENLSRDEVIARAEGTERYEAVKELARKYNRFTREYKNYKYDKANGIITADELEDVITVLSPKELSYKGDVYKITNEIPFEYIEGHNWEK